MKKLIATVLMAVLLAPFGRALAQPVFDLSVFERQQGVILDDSQMWCIFADEERATGKIWPNVIGKHEEFLENQNLVSIGAYIVLDNYGTPDFKPFPQIDFDLDIRDGLVVDTVIFQVGELSYPFYDINVKTKERGSELWEKLRCQCLDSVFMDAWIENQGSVGVKLQGGTRHIDWEVTEDMRKNIAVMFKNFRDAGGYDFLETTAHE